VNQLDWIEAFAAVARAGGFSAAARQLGSPVATVSRKVGLLEQSLGVRLLSRSTRHVSLTDSGRDYFDACSRVLDDLREANERVAGEYRKPKGLLIVTAPVGFGRKHLQPVMHEFLRKYRDVDIDLRLGDRIVPLVEEHVDCAVRISTLPDSTLVARPLGEIRMVVCGSPAYLKQHGVPRHPDDLMRHSCICWTSLGPYKAWDFQVEPGSGKPERLVPVRMRLASTTAESAVDAAVDGVGLVQATSYQLAPAVRAGQLKPVLRDFESMPVPVSLVYPGKRLIPLKLRAFLDFATPRLRQRLDEVAGVL
jgi:DNA-binding transcriptional LysR family regulator